MRHMLTESKGFTLVEVLVISPIIILFIGAFIALLVNMTGESLVIREKNTAAYDTQAALDDIEATINQATSYLTTTGTVPIPQGRDNSTSSGTPFTNAPVNGFETLIISSPATTRSPQDSTRSLIYTGSGACDSKNPLYNYLTVYYVAPDNQAASGNALYKRTILPAQAACASAWQRGSCDSTRVSGYPSVCKRADERLVGGLSSFDIQYFVGSTTTPIAQANESTQANTATDVTVNINVGKSVAGNNVNYSSSSRSTSVNIQASGPDQTPTPTNPMPTWTRSDTTNPYTTTVTWSRIGNATSYIVRYNINGVVQSPKTINQPGSGNPSTTIDSPTIARKQSVQLTGIDVVTGSGTFAYGSMPAISDIERWTACPLMGGWQNYGWPYNDSGYTRTRSGAVGLKGLVRYGSVGSTVCDLPDAFAPQDHLIFPVLAADPSTGTQSYGRLDIYPNGHVNITATPSSGNGWVSLDGVIFMTAAGSPAWTGGTYINGWYFNTYGDTYSNLKYYRDTRGRAWVQGLATGGPPDQRMAWMTAAMAPQYGSMHIPASADNRGGAVNINGDPSILSRPSYGSYVSTQFLYNSNGSMSDMFLYNGWYNYSNGWSLAKCIRYDDDVVVLQGLVAGGNPAAGGMAGVHNCGGVYGLPFMSTERNAILPGWANWERAARIDLNTDEYLYPITVDQGWTSLDGIHYIAD